MNRICNFSICNANAQFVKRLSLKCDFITLGILQKNHPGIAIAIKTRHASRSVLNQMKATLSDLRADGITYIFGSQKSIYTFMNEKFKIKIYSHLLL